MSRMTNLEAKSCVRQVQVGVQERFFPPEGVGTAQAPREWAQNSRRVWALLRIGFWALLGRTKHWAEDLVCPLQLRVFLRSMNS